MSQENSLQYQDILSALKSHVNSSVFSIFIPSIQKSVAFRQITIEEQKFLSKRTVEDSSNVKNMYETFIALISKLCIDETVQIETLTELDRIKILIELFRKNYNIDKYEITCPKCGHKFKTSIDFGTLLSEFDKFDNVPFLHEISSSATNGTYQFSISPPTIKRIREYNTHCEQTNSEVSSEPFERSDFYKTFIKSITVVINDKTDPIHIDVEKLTFKQFDSIIDTLPVDIIFSENGVVSALISKYISKLAEIKSDIVCPQCGHKIEGAVSPSSFFQ